MEEQRAILQRTFDYLQNAIPKLPDFYAFRNTVRFEEPPERDNEIWKMPHQDQNSPLCHRGARDCSLSKRARGG